MPAPVDSDLLAGAAGAVGAGALVAFRRQLAAWAKRLRVRVSVEAGPEAEAPHGAAGGEGLEEIVGRLLAEKLAELHAQVAALRAEVAALRLELDGKDRTIADQAARIAHLESLVATRDARIAELEDRIAELEEHR